MKPQLDWFVNARYGLFIHYGLYSLLERGEWVLNREAIPRDEYKKLADSFTAENFDIDDIIKRAANDWEMRYAILTTKHHDGFCLYDSQLSDFKSTNSACQRDLVAEFVAACRKHGIKVGLYHTLNDWTAPVTTVDALEDPEKYRRPMLDFVHGQIREIMTNYGEIDIMWYDGWWPFADKGWEGPQLNEMVRELQPNILINGRTGTPGDFDTPEQHIAASDGPWEACITLNDHWGYHRGDNRWKEAPEVIDMLRKCSCGHGNLLLNIGPEGDGSVPQPTIDILDETGVWLKENQEAIFGTNRFYFNYMGIDPNAHNDWNYHGPLTASGHNAYWLIRHWPGPHPAVLAHLQCQVQRVTELVSGRELDWQQDGTRLIITGLEEKRDTRLPVVWKIECDSAPVIYNCGGYRIPNVEHCRYDPVTSDIGGGD